MKKITKTLFFTLFILLSGCMFFTTYGRYYKQAERYYANNDFNKAIEYYIKSINLNLNYEKSINRFEQVVPKAFNYHYEKIKASKLITENFIEIIENYNNFFNLIKKLEKASISKSYLLHINKNIYLEYDQELQKAANFHYKKGLEFMSYTNKENYKSAYKEFVSCENYIKNYKEVEKYLKECKKNSTFNITILDLKNNSRKKYDNIGKSISNKLVSSLSNNNSFIESVDIINRKDVDIIMQQLKLSNSGLIDSPTTELGKLKDIDHIIKGEINTVIINEPKKTTARTRIKNNENNSTKYTQKNNRLEAFVSLEVYLEILDVETSEIINSKTFQSELVNIEEWEERGFHNDKGNTLFENLIATIAINSLLDTRKSRAHFSSDEMLNQVIDDINIKMKNYLIKFYE